MTVRLVPAEPGWNVVLIYRRRDNKLTIKKVTPVTQWSKAEGGYPYHNGERICLDPSFEEIRHVIATSYLMNPDGQLLNCDREVLFETVFDLNDWYRQRWPGLEDVAA